jgi:predicted regulator of Ras-like GTPase activity (Roadblock/LC7/MglB family)
LKSRTNVADEKTDFSDSAVISIGEEKSTFASLSTSMTEIRKLKGVIGYILRSNESAIIDLASSEKLTDYAIFSYEVVEACKEMIKNFNFGETESMLVEGESVKVLCMNIDENKVSVFMEKNATHAGIIKRILL